MPRVHEGCRWARVCLLGSERECKGFPRLGTGLGTGRRGLLVGCRGSPHLQQLPRLPCALAGLPNPWWPGSSLQAASPSSLPRLHPTSTPGRPVVSLSVSGPVCGPSDLHLSPFPPSPPPSVSLSLSFTSPGRKGWPRPCQALWRQQSSCSQVLGGPNDGIQADGPLWVWGQTR